MPRDLSIPTELTRIRKKLDYYDKKILKLFRKRFLIIQKLAKLKVIYDFPVEDEEREEKMRKKWRKIFKAKKNDTEFIDDLFDLVVESSKDMQESYFTKKLK